MWRIEVVLAEGVPIAPFEAAIAPNDGAVAITRGDVGGWRLAAYAETMPDRGELGARIAVAAALVRVEPPAPTIEPVPEIDWIQTHRR